MSDPTRYSEHFSFAERTVGRALAEKASPTLLRAMAQADDGFEAAGAELLSSRARFRHPSDGFILELDDDAMPDLPDPQPGAGPPDWFTARRKRFRKRTRELTGDVPDYGAELRAVEDLWLVSSLRVRTSLRLVSDLAESDEVKSVDLPRLLHPDAGERAGFGLGTNCSASYRAAVEAVHQEAGNDGAGARVALLDGEVDLGHPSFNGRVQLAGNLTSETGNVPDTHATALAGLLLGTASVPGVVPSAEVLNYKVIPTLGFQQDDATLVRALQAAIDDGISLVVCALSLPPADDQPDRARTLLERAAFANRIVCKSAGNRGPDPSTMTEPSGRGSLIVGACNDRGTHVAGYSSRGPDRLQQPAPDVLAPGGELLKPLWSAHPGDSEGPIENGTSNSCALALGVVACLHAANPNEPLSALRGRLAALARAVPLLPATEQGVGAVLAH
jgi:subtilisin family serine protease